MHDLDLLRRFEPIIRYTAGELFLPAGVEEYLRLCELWSHTPAGASRLVPAGQVDVARLEQEGLRHPGPGLWLRLVDRPFGRRQVAAWRRRPDRPRFHGGSRLAQVGILSRGIDVANRLTLTLRGRVAAGAQAAAETRYRTGTTAGHHPYYGRVLRQGGYVVLQYWFFYCFNDWRSRVYGVNDHEADWEQVTVFLAEHLDSVEPAWVAFSSHDAVGDDLRRRWDDPDLERVGEHPVVNAGLGSHSGAYLPGDYLVAFDPPAFRGLIRAGRRVSRRLLPWHAQAEHTTIGIPYVDYHRGDGPAIGPGQAATWTPVPVDDDTPWIASYRGLWGDDTQDPFGGERGPAGPRYERDGSVRVSWGDPVGWAGLDKVSPSAEARRAAVRARLDRIDADVDALEQQCADTRNRLRAQTASGAAVPAADEAAAVDASMRRVELHDERIRLEDSLRRDPPVAGPHDHLRHREQPLPSDDRARTRMLAVWAAVSTPLILLTLSLLVLPFGPSILATAGIALLMLFLMEAYSRGHLASFALGLLLAVVTVGAAVAVVVGLIANWRITTAVVLAATAIGVFVVNAVELRRD